LKTWIHRKHHCHWEDQENQWNQHFGFISTDLLQKVIALVSSGTIRETGQHLRKRRAPAQGHQELVRELDDLRVRKALC
jgi:hypothetical protein